MKDIAETAGISKGAIYHHFQSKDEIIEAVMEKQAHTVTDAMEGWLADEDSLDGRERNLESRNAIWCSFFWKRI